MSWSIYLSLYMFVQMSGMGGFDARYTSFYLIYMSRYYDINVILEIKNVINKIFYMILGANSTNKYILLQNVDKIVFPFKNWFLVLLSLSKTQIFKRPCI
jgi:hypothetical protein